MNQYIYVLIREDLEWGQRAVQAGHAVLEMVRQHGPEMKTHPSFVYLAIKDEEELKDWIYKLVAHNKFRFTAFQEPDINNAFTALATEPICGEDRKFFKHLKKIK